VREPGRDEARHARRVAPRRPGVRAAGRRRGPARPARRRDRANPRRGRPRREPARRRPGGGRRGAGGRGAHAGRGRRGPGRAAARARDGRAPSGLRAARARCAAVTVQPPAVVRGRNNIVQAAVARRVRAIGLYEYGGPEVLQVLDLPEPQVGPGEVRIRVHAAAVNPTDVMLRTGGHAVRSTARPPFVPGMDVAGVVDQVGPGVGDRLVVGQPVIGMVLFVGPRGGAYADKVVLPAASVVPAPAGVGLAAASTLLMNALTARMALDVAGLRPGDTVAVTGAAGAVGAYAIELATADGLTVVADAAERDVDLVRSFGADHVVERGAGVAEQIREIVPAGVPALVDGSD